MQEGIKGIQKTRYKLKVCATTDFYIHSQGSGTRTLLYQGLLSRTQDLCQDSIMKILGDREFPDWNDLILDTRLN